MKAGFLLLAVLALAICSSQSEEPGPSAGRIAFARDSNIWIANIDGTKPRKLTSGADPCLSPDGTKVAFTMSPPNAKDVVRFIAVTDIFTGATKVFEETPSNNCFGPVWSPDGSQILFEILVENHWRLGLLDADGSGFRYFKLPAANHEWWSATWAPDTKSIFCQDLEKISQFSVDGDLLAWWEIGRIVPKGDMDSSKRLSVSGDGKKLLICINMDDEEAPKDWEGPPPAIWLFDVPSGKATRLTPKKSFASDCCWVGNQEFLLVDADKVGKGSSIYRASITGGTPRLIIKNGVDPTVSTGSP